MGSGSVSDARRSTTGFEPSGDAGTVAVTLAGVQWGLAWNVRGDSGRSSFVSEAEGVLGLALPLQPNTSVRGDGWASLWLGPSSWLFVGGPGSARTTFDIARTALNAAGGALFDLSASYVGWSIAGAAAGHVLNRACPLDLHPRSFRPGHCAQSLLGHINALFYRPDEQPLFIVMVARSLAASAWRDLCASAASDGYRVAPAVSFGAVGFSAD
jgi:sarcosine oxidase, subunit gamma